MWYSCLLKKCIGILFIWTFIFTQTAYADNQNQVQATTYVTGYLLKDDKLVLDFGKNSNLIGAKYISILDDKENIIQDVQLSNLDTTSLLIEGKRLERIKKIIIDKQQIAVNSVNKRLTTDKLFVNKEQSGFIDNERLILEFTQPVDIRTLNDLYLSNKGVIYKPLSVEYYVDYLGVKDFRKISVKYESLKTNELYQLQLDGKVVGLRGEKSILSNEQSVLKIVRDTYDYEPPILASTQAKSTSEIALNFLDASDLSMDSVFNTNNFKITNYSTGQKIELLNSNLIYNSQTKKLSEIRLRVGELSLDQLYQIEFSGVKDVNNNSVSGKAMVSFFDYDERGPKLQRVDVFSNTMLRLSFSREVFVPHGYENENISIGNNVKVLNVMKDPLINNAILVKTTAHEQKSMHRVTVEGIQDKYNIGSTKQYNSSTYYPIMGDANKLDITLIETGNVKGQYAITVTFTDPLPEDVERFKEQFSISDLEIYYVYRINDKQIRVITSPHVAGKVYNLKVNTLESVYGATNTTLYRSFAGVVFE